MVAIQATTRIRAPGPSVISGAYVRSTNAKSIAVAATASPISPPTTPLLFLAITAVIHLASYYFAYTAYI
jgi:hypothetical protein